MEELSQKDIDSIFNNQRIDEAVPEEAPLASPLQLLRTFRKFITGSRKKLGKCSTLLKEKEAQLTELHRQTVDSIKKKKRIDKYRIDFFDQRVQDYKQMIQFVLESSQAGMIVNAIPSFGSVKLRQPHLLSKD